MARVVVGLYDKIEEAQRAVQDLVQEGFPRDKISMLANDSEGRYAKYIDKKDAGDAKEGAATGAGIGAVVGAIGGLLVGLGTIAIPGLGVLLAAGPIVGLLAGAGIGAAAGGLVGALIDLGIPEERAERYASEIERGGTLVMVHTSDDRASRAVDILNRHNPVDIDQRDRQHTQGMSTTSRSTSEGKVTGEEAKFDVVEEELRVGKRTEDKEGLRAHTYVTEQEVEEHVSLRNENINVDRHRVDRTLSPDEADRAFQEESFEVTARREEPVVEKRAHVVEEVEIDKDVEIEDRTIHETLRRKDVEIERMSSEELSEYEPMFQQHYDTTFSQTGERYEDFRPAYHYGYEMGSQPQYRSRSWEEIEKELSHDWGTRYQNRSWDTHRQAVHQGWTVARRSR